MNDFTLSDDAFARIGQAVTAKAAAADRSRLRRHKIAAWGAVGVAAATGVGAAWVAQATPELRENAVYCYSEASTGSEFATVASPLAETSDGETIQLSGSAIAMCAAVWEIGEIGGNGIQPEEGKSYLIPPLQACVRNDGVTSVFPADAEKTGAQFCRDLGLIEP
ncbi:hypothetical protein [Cryobacterium zongtaii]|uniref:hypothetical protein n=1 Tax=Cryobacterium zongtaii TaxID=1259217 RepID=UPI0010570190|nr:hypothetical protein [Cryobacterium zongtaii]